MGSKKTQETINHYDELRTITQEGYRFDQGEYTMKCGSDHG